MAQALSTNELLYLAMLHDAKEVFGVTDIFYGKGDSEIRTLVDQAARCCMEKGLLIADFDKKTKLAENLDKHFQIIVSADKVSEIIIRNTKAYQKRYLFYTRKNETVVLFEEAGEYFFVDEADIEKIYSDLEVLFSRGCLFQIEPRSFSISQEEIASIHASKKSKTAAIRALMHERRANELIALLITEGATGAAGCFSAATLNLVDDSVETVFFIAESGLVLRVSIDEQQNMIFDVEEIEIAKQTALSFLRGDQYV